MREGAPRTTSSRATGASGPSSAALLSIFMLGPFRLLRGERDLQPATWDLRKAVAVLKYLVLEEGRWVPTDVLVEQLWPDEEPRRARSALRTTVYSLRRALQPELGRYEPSLFVEACRGHYRFRTDAPYWWDVEEFLRLARQARQALARGDARGATGTLREALALYRDELLPEDLQAEWTALWRERLRQSQLDLLLQWSELVPVHAPELQGELLQRLRVAAARAPEREDVWRALLAALWRAGNAGEALRQYEVLCRRLREDFDVEPTPETQDLVRRIRRGSCPASAPAQAAAQLQARAGSAARASGDRAEGAMVLGWPVFRQVVELERRRLARGGAPAVVALVAKAPARLAALTAWDELEMRAQPVDGSLGPAAWQGAMARYLRRSDAVCPLDPGRLLLLLPGADRAVAGQVVQRVLAAVDGDPGDYSFQILPLPPPE